MSSPLTVKKSQLNNVDCRKLGSLFSLPVVDIEQPVESEVQAERDVDGLGVGGRDRLVEGAEHGDHVAHVEQLVVLPAQAVRVERLDRHVQVE